LIRAHLATMVGTRQEVLVEGPSKGGAGMFEGRTARNEIVHLEAPADRTVIGEIVEVEIVRANKHSLAGVLGEDARARLPALRATHAATKRRRMLPLAAG